MKTIKIFLASSEELDYDRVAFGNLVRRLDDMYEKRGIRIKLFEWEDYDAAYNDKRKQDEYNEYVKQSDIFLALFHKKAGQFTIEEFDKASEQFKATASPKVYTYCKDLKPGEEESQELKEFKERLFNEMGHYWCRYDNRESLQFQFVMQLQLVESNRMDDVKVEDGVVTINGLPVAKMENLKFAAANEDYLRMSEELTSLPEEIEMYRMMAEAHQDQPKYFDQLKKKLDKFNQLKKDLQEFQENLFKTAKRIIQLQGDHITERMRRAMDAFNEGKAHEANIILDEAEEDARRNLKDYEQSKEITELRRQAAINSIKELRLKIDTVYSDASIFVDKRIKKVEEIYDLVNTIFLTVDSEKDEYYEFLFEYAGGFMVSYGSFQKTNKLLNELLFLHKKLYGNKNLYLVYLVISDFYRENGDFIQAINYLKKSIKNCEENNDEEHPPYYYSLIGYYYNLNGNFDLAIEYCQKALDFYLKEFGDSNEHIAPLYNEFGTVYYNKGDYNNATNYYLKSAELGDSRAQLHLGWMYITGNGVNQDYTKAFVWYLKAAENNNVDSQFELGNMYFNGEGVDVNYEKAFEWYSKAAQKGNTLAMNALARMYQKGVGIDKDEKKAYQLYLDAALQGDKDAMFILGCKFDQGDNIDETKAVEWYMKAAQRGDSYSQFNLGCMYASGRGVDKDDTKAVEWFEKAALQGDKRAQSALGVMYGSGRGVQLDVNKAIEWLKKSAEQKYEESFNYLSWYLHILGKYDEALPWAEKAAEAFPQNPNNIDTLASVYQNLGRYDDALEQFELCLKLYKEQENSEGINKTDTKIAELKELMKNGGVPEQ